MNEGLHWWCSGALNVPWTWTWQPFPGVWAVVLLFLAGYTCALRRQGVTRRARMASGYLAILLVWAFLDWPLGALGAGYLASVHAVKFLVLAFLAPALFWSVFADEYDETSAPVQPGYGFAFLSALFFNIVVIVTHVPAVVDTLAATQFGSFFTDMLLIGAGLLFWRNAFKSWPLPNAPVKVLYIILGTLLHLGLGILFLLSPYPLYSIFELAPRVSEISARADQAMAGAVMLLVGSPLVFAIVGRVFTPYIRLRIQERNPTARNTPQP